MGMIIYGTRVFPSTKATTDQKKNVRFVTKFIPKDMYAIHHGSILITFRFFLIKRYISKCVPSAATVWN